MAEMKFKFTIQPYQTEAVDSVVSVFAGQPFNDRFTYRRDVEIERDVTNWMLSDEELFMGFANGPIKLDFGQMLTNINRIQGRNNIGLAQTIASGGLGACSLDVEMETGTGKTYVYIKTMFELNKQTTSWNTTARRRGSSSTILRIWRRSTTSARARISTS